jgi:hypothetical protein
VGVRSTETWLVDGRRVEGQTAAYKRFYGSYGVTDKPGHDPILSPPSFLS